MNEVEAPDGLVRIIATADLHGHLRGYDYERRRPLLDRGLDRAARVIAELRAGAQASILVDAGDFLDDETATATVGQPPAIVAAMTALGYDAAALGNHEIDRGIARLATALQGAAFPVLCDNLRIAPGQPWSHGHIIARTLSPGADAPPCRIGVTGLLPPETATPADGMPLDLAPVAETAAATVAALRAAGADLVVAICHEGIVGARPAGALRALARTRGIDALVMGHRHGVFPPEGAEDDRVGGLPAVMPGSYGTHVGCIDLSVAHVAGAWRVAAARARTIPVPQDVSADRHPVAETIESESREVHRATLRAAARVVGHTRIELSSHFVHLGRSSATRFVARAMRRAVERRLGPDPSRRAPVVGLAAPGASGGFGGAWNYVSIPPGPMTDHELRRLHPHDDRIVGLAATGADLVLWLERSVSALERVAAGCLTPRLVRPEFPGSDFDLPDRVTFEVDLSRPAAFDRHGHRTAPMGRVRDVRIDGVPLDPDAPLLLATTAHRAGGGGGFPLPPGASRLDTDETVQSAIAAAIDSGLRPPGPHIFRFAPLPHAEAILQTSPAAEDRIGASALDLRVLRREDDGFLSLLLRFGGAALETEARAG